MTTFENSTFKDIIEKWNTMTTDCFAYYKKAQNASDFTQNIYTYL